LSPWEGFWDANHDLIRSLTDLPLPPNDVVTLEFQMPMDHGDLIMGEMAVFIYDEYEVYYDGNVQIGPDGLATAELTTPQVDATGPGHMVLTMVIEYRWEGYSFWSQYISYLVVSDGRPPSYWERRVDQDLSMNLEPAKEPGLYDVSIEVPEAIGGDSKVSLLWGLDEPYSTVDEAWSQGYVPRDEFCLDRWMHTNPRQYGGEYFWRTNIEACNFKDGAYRTQMRLPWFLDDDAPIYFLGVVEDDNSMEPRVVLVEDSMGNLWDWASRGPPKEKNRGQEHADDGPFGLPNIDGLSDDPILSLALVILAISGTSLLIVVALRRMKVNRSS